MRLLSGRTMGVVAAVVAAAAGPAVPAASAAPAPVRAAGAWTAALAPGSTAEFLDVATDQPISCDRSAASGTDHVIQQVTWECAGEPGSTTDVEQSGPMVFDPASSSGGVISGSVSGVNVRFAIDTLFGTCSGSISGSVSNAVFNTVTGEFSVPGGTGLSISNVDNCSGLLNDGDPAAFTATYRVVFA
ncbi:hypothetical protein [Streptomyces sp. NBC_00046]|uniref:hypothetical protein n=1 Tax=unclassified Streptomyces TaxID=2593676 RepID=UPI00324812A0